MLLKLTGLLVLLSFAFRHHFRLGPQLAGARAPHALARFRASLGVQLLVAVLVIAIAMVLSAMPPPASMPK